MTRTLLPLALVACGTAEVAPTLTAGTDQEVSVVADVLQAFDDDNTRTVEFSATLPEPALWKKIVLDYRLDCPGGGCDPWDRWGNVELLLGEGEDAVPLEIARVMTPYGVGGRWRIDVTDLAPVLTGEVTFRSSIDTWVGGGLGWLVSIDLRFEGGEPERRPVAVVPVFSHWVAYGDPDNPPAEQLPAREVPVPAGATTARLRAMVTGHGQANLDNCAEFCVTEHTLTAGEERHAWTVWRDDCADNKVSNQAGNWRPNRAGWCPGDKVTPHTWDVTLAGQTSLAVGWEPEAYENTCRGVEPCIGCLGQCEYNDSSHTPPRWSVGLAAIFFE